MLTDDSVCTGCIDLSQHQTLRQQLEAMHLQHMSPNVQQRLIQMHAACREEAAEKRPWQITEDAQLLDEHLGGEPTTEISIRGRNQGAIKRRMIRLKSRLSFSRSALPRIKSDAEAPYLTRGISG